MKIRGRKSNSPEKIEKELKKMKRKPLTRIQKKEKETNKKNWEKEKRNQ